MAIQAHQAFYRVSPSPAGPAGCCPLNFLNLINLKIRVRAPNGCCILQFRPNQSFVCNFLCTPRCNANSCEGNQVSKLLWKIFLRHADPNPFICNGDTMVCCRMNIFVPKLEHHFWRKFTKGIITIVL